MVDFDWNQAFSGYGTFLTVGALVVVFKAVFGAYWTDMFNRIGTVILAIGIAVAATYAHGAIQSLTVPWYIAVGAAVNGVIVGGALLGVNAVYRVRVKEDVGTTFRRLWLARRARKQVEKAAIQAAKVVAKG